MLFADLHIHSRYSQGTSKYLTLDELNFWATKKGLHLLGTGDCTHKAWLNELETNLCYNENSGFYTHKNKENTLSYILQGEISCVFKQDGRAYRVHNLVYLPNFEAAHYLRKKLEKIGNIEADGRPILKLSSRNLLEIILEIPNAFLIPAHIWTPWYSLFGKKSGFENIEDCFQDLSPHIFSLETGLSSDLSMNRTCKQLNSYSFISNSDAHSGQNLAREVNIFEGDLNYQSLFQALNLQERNKASCNFIGTAEVYPMHGKYYTSGHRACKISLQKDDYTEICPHCNKKLTEGVAQRVHYLSHLTSSSEENLPIFHQEEFHFLPLRELLSFVYGVGEKSKKVQSLYDKVTENSSEFEILLINNSNDISALLENEKIGKIIQLMRERKLTIEAGYDGIYGEIKF